MKQKTIKRVVSMCLVVSIAFSLAACGTNQKTDGPDSIDNTPEASTSEPSQEPTPSQDEPSEAPTQGQEAEPSQEPTPGQDEPSEAPTPSQEPTSTPTNTPTPTSTPTPTQESTPPSTTTPTQVHTHSYSGGNCQTKSTCSICGEVGGYGEHTWNTKEVYHQATGHEETKEETEQVLIGYRPTGYGYICGDGSDDGGPFGCGFKTSDPDEMHNHQRNMGHSGNVVIRYGDDEPIYETRTTFTTYWVEDTPAWTEYITTCSVCGTTQ